jgi:hypothetical protein
MVGISGRIVERFKLETASARVLPALIWGKDDIVGAPSIVHDHGLTQPLRELGTDNSRHHIWGRTRYLGDDAADRVVRVGLSTG